MNKNGALGVSWPKLNATLDPTKEEIAWAAGFYEGEGTCHFNSGTEVVEIGQKDDQDNKEILICLRDLFGGSVKTKIIKFKTGRPDLHYVVWRCYGTRARNFLFTIFPFLFNRRKEQILKCLHQRKEVNRQKEVMQKGSLTSVE